MKKDIKLYVGEGSPGPNWIHAKDFSDFQSILDTVALNNINLIKFAKSLDQENSYMQEVMTPTDCAVELVERGRGNKLPQCFIEEDDNSDIEMIINHYVDSYKFDNYCGKILA